MLRLIILSGITLSTATALAAPAPTSALPSKNVYSVDVNMNRNDQIIDSNFTVKANEDAPAWAAIESETGGDKILVELKSLKELHSTPDGRSVVQAAFSVKEKQENGSFKILSSPTVSTIENEPALISQVSEGEDGAIVNSLTLKFMVSKKAL